MTYLPHDELERRRELGLSPKGGPLPDDLAADVLRDEPREGLFPEERAQQLQNLFRAFDEYPNDFRLLRRMSELLGRQVAPAEAHCLQENLLKEAMND